MTPTKLCPTAAHIWRLYQFGLMYFHLNPFTAATTEMLWHFHLCPLGQGAHQGGPQMSENGEKIKAINFPHLNNTLKLPKNTYLENIDSSYSPPEHETRSCTHSVQSPGNYTKLIKKSIHHKTSIYNTPRIINKMYTPCINTNQQTWFHVLGPELQNLQ